MRPRSEDRLFARYRANCDVTALAGVYDRTASELLRVAMHLSLCPAEAEDLVQATFVAAIQNADSYDPTRPVLPWLLGILSNQAKLARWRNGRSPNPDSLPSERMIDPLEQVQVQEFTRAVDDAIDALPEPYRPVLRLKLKHGFCAAEIAHALGRPPGTVRTQLVRATKLLRQALPSGFTVAVLGISTQARGLAAIRQAVLAEAAAGPTALTMTIGIGGTLLMMKKLVVVVTVCLFALGTTWLYRSWDDSNDIEHVDGTAVAVLDAPTSEHSSESTVLPLQVRHMVPKLAVAESRPGAIAATKGQHVFLGCVREELSRRGLNGVRVTLSRRNSTQLIASTITNDEGSFGLDAVPTDADLTVTLSKNGYATRGYFLHFEADSRQVTRDFEMGFGVLIQGTVSDYTTGAPISRAEIFDRGSSLAKLCISEEGGRFSFRLQPMGGEKKLAFHIRADGYCKITSKYTVAELGPRSDLRITLPRQCGVRGIVRDSSGKVLQGAQVVVLPGPHHKRKPSPLDALWKRWRHEVRSIGCKTNEDGEYAVTTLMPWTGPYKVRTVKKGYQTQFNALTGLGAPGDVKELQVTLENLQPGARISGFLTLNGKPCRGGIEWKGPTRNGRILLKGGDSAGFTMTVEAGRVEFLAHLSSNVFFTWTKVPNTNWHSQSR